MTCRPLGISERFMSASSSWISSTLSRWRFSSPAASRTFFPTRCARAGSVARASTYSWIRDSRSVYSSYRPDTARGGEL